MALGRGSVASALHGLSVRTMRNRPILSEIPAILKLAVPLMIGMAAATLLGVTDTLFVAPLGAVPLAAVSLTTSVAVIFYASIWGMLSNIGIGVARAHGARTPREIAGLVRNGLVLGALVGVCSTLLMLAILPMLGLMGQPPEVLAVIAPYYVPMALLLTPYAMMLVLKQMFDAIDRPWLAVGFAFIAVVVNVPLNWALINGALGMPRLGLAGAGIASLVSETTGLLLTLGYWRFARSMRRMRVRAPVTHAAVAREAVEGAPIGLMYVGETGAIAFAGMMLSWFGANALAANQIAASVGAVLYMMPLGVAGAVAIRVGQASGSGEGARVRPIGLAAIVSVVGWMLVSTAILVLFGGLIAKAMASTPAVATLAAGMFVVMAFLQIVDGVQTTALGALRGIGDTRWPTVVSLVAYWIIALPLAWLLAFPAGFGPLAIWAGYGLGLAFAAVMLPLRFLRRTRDGAARETQ
jgi:multidrug resistance protein, MATE family